MDDWGIARILKSSGRVAIVFVHVGDTAVESDTAYVALGVSVVWETVIEYGIDDVTITFDPRPG